MSSMPPGLHRSVMTWVSQVSVSVGATLIATMIYGALPKVTIPQLEPAPELTSGGKFAARALPPDAPQVFDGLDTMPLPRVAVSDSVLPAAFVTTAAQSDAATPPFAAPAAGVPAAGPLRRIVGDGGPIERPIRAAKTVHLPQRADAKHPARLVTAEAAAPIAQVSSDEPTATTDDGLLPKVMSTARGAWAVTASASDALLAHVIPQIP